MREVSIVGLDLAERVFQVHGTDTDGGVVFRWKLSRGEVLVFFTELPRCIVAMEHLRQRIIGRARSGSSAMKVGLPLSGGPV
jgi:transposase